MELKLNTLMSIVGGDLMNLLIKMEIFDEPFARFYIAELTCAIESVHKMGFIHRYDGSDDILGNLNSENNFLRNFFTVTSSPTMC